METTSNVQMEDYDSTMTRSRLLHHAKGFAQAKEDIEALWVQVRATCPVLMLPGYDI